MTNPASSPDHDGRLRRAKEAALDAAADAVVITDRDGRIEWVNDAFARLTGYGLAEVEGRTPAVLKSGHQADSVYAELWQTILAGRAWHGELVNRRRDGELYVEEQTITPVLDPQGSIVSFVGIKHDITERRRTEDRLRESELRYRRLFETAKDGILILDAETGNIVDVNPFLMDLLGYARVHFLGKKLWEIGAFEDLELSRKAFAELQRTTYVRYEDLPLVARDGERIDVEFVSNVYPVNGAKVIQCNIRDISERVRAAATVGRSQAILRSLVENAPLGIFRATAEGTLLTVNPALVAMLGYDSAAELLARNLVTDMHRNAADWARVLDRRRRGMTDAVEVEWERKDGAVITVRMTARAVDEAGGVGEILLVFVEDVTELRKTEQLYRHAQTLEVVGQLAGGVAHDFNNLLTVILGRCALLLGGQGADGARDRRHAETIQATAERAAKLTQQLLAVSRRQVLLPVVLDLGKVVTGFERILRRLIREDIELVIVNAPRLGHVQADPTQIEQILMNLAVNARDAMPRAGRLTIEAADADLDAEFVARNPGAQPGPYVRLTVQDTGIGMDEGTRARLFEPFFTTKMPGVGTGLGLATVYGIVKQSRGYVAVASAPGQGTRFDIFLPRVEVVPAEPVPAAALETRRGTETILLVEDEVPVRELVREILEAQAYTVLEARDAEDAVRMADQHDGPLHLLLSDVVMPVLSGPQVAERVVRRRPRTRVLLMTGYVSDAVVRADIDRAAVAVLLKPFTPDVLVQKVREVLDA